MDAGHSVLPSGPQTLAKVVLSHLNHGTIIIIIIIHITTALHSHRSHLGLVILFTLEHDGGDPGPEPQPLLRLSHHQGRRKAQFTVTAGLVPTLHQCLTDQPVPGG